INFLEMIGRGKVPEVLVGSCIVMGLLLLFGLAVRASLASAGSPEIPDEKINVRSVAEVIVEQVANFVHSVLGSHGHDLVPFIGCLFLFILGCNLFGLIPGMEPPTANSNLTFALGLIAFVYYQWLGLRAQGMAYVRSFLGP